MTHFDLLIIGTGSGNTLPGPEFDGQTIALVEKGTFGGTCLNVGCIPTKMFAYTAEVAAMPSKSSKYGVTETLDAVDWPAIRDRVFGRIDPIAAGGEEYRKVHEDNRNLTVFQGVGRFTGPKTLTVALGDGDVEITADKIVIAAGSRPVFPPATGIEEAQPLTSDSVMRMEELPQSMLILGSGFIAAEMAHVFSSLGVDVTLIARSKMMLSSHDRDIAEAYTTIASGTYTVRCGFNTTAVERRDGRVYLTGMAHDEVETLEADELLVAVGRNPNSDTLAVGEAGISTHDDGRIRVDSYQRVLDIDGNVIDGVFALGDISSDWQLKHVANKEAKTVRHNLLHPDDMIETDHRYVPSAVFGDPQIASVGMTEGQAQIRGVDYVVAKQDYAGIAYGWAMEDTTGFVKIIADPETTEIFGAHIMGPHAPTLIQILIQAMSTGQTARDIASTQYWIHPAMPELIENALLQITE